VTGELVSRDSSFGIAAPTGGQVICHLVKANPDMPPEDGTGWHRHDCDFQIDIMTKGTDKVPPVTSWK
jgi:hypothetical protein